MIREIGRIVGDGPTVVFIGGLHGNEPAGVHALHRFFTRYDAGEFGRVGANVLAVAGNLRALDAGRRHLDSDLNRHWTDPEVEAVLGKPPEARRNEDLERVALLEIVAGLPTPSIFVDLHTTSARAAPFTVVPDRPGNRALARDLGVPALLGLAETLDGNLVGYLGRMGHVGVGVEGGAHADPGSVDCHESIVVLTLDALDCFEPALDISTHRARLALACIGHPLAARIVFRHGISEEDCFVMEPGLTNFQPVSYGQVVARDRNGPVRVPMDGLMMLPRYQGQGDDGFFIAHHAAL